MQSMLFHSQLNSMNNWVVVITTGGQMEGKQWIIFKLWQSHHGNTTQGNANKLDRFKRTMQLCGIHHSLTTLLKYIIFNEIYLFFAVLLRPISITHCMHLNFHCGVSIAGTWSYPSLSPSLTQRNTVCICKHRSSPNQIFFFLISARREVNAGYFIFSSKKEDHTWAWDILHHENTSAKHYANKGGRKSILSTWMFIFYFANW